MNEKTNEAMSRRRFIGLTGTAAGMAALAPMGLSAGWESNQRTINCRRYELAGRK